MTPTPLSLADRIRLYLTLTLQVVPLIVLLFTISNSKSLLLIIPLLLTAIGIIMELTGRSAGRVLALGMLGLQALVMCGVLVFVIYMTNFAGSPDDKLTAGDLPTLLLLLVPLGIFLWNYLGGRKAVVPAGATSRA